MVMLTRTFTEEVPTGDQKWYRDGNKQSDIKRIYVGKGGDLKTFSSNSYRLDGRTLLQQVGKAY